MLHELKIPVNHKPNGQFAKGHTPHNKGKQWDDYMPKEHQQRILRKLNRSGRKYHTNREAPNAKPIVVIKNNKIVGHFKSSYEAGRKMNLQHRNIRKVAQGHRKTCGGFQFKFENDI
ncbi:MAG: hypothetical protein K9J21_12445 [Bacteroidales bacterium]|nr:hypothetical protein [Bacteroidales bacterium]